MPDRQLLDALDDCSVFAPGLEVVHGTFGDFFYGLGLVANFKATSSPDSNPETDASSITLRCTARISPKR